MAVASTTVTTYKRTGPKSGARTYKKPRVGGKGYTRTVGYYGRFPPAVPSGLGELKFFDTRKTSTAVATSGVIWEPSLNLIPQGVTENTRVGRKCTIKSIYLKMSAALTSSAISSATDDGIRVMLILDKQCNGTASTVTDVLETAEYLAFNNLANRGRYQVLMSKYIDISATAGGIGGSSASGTVGKTFEWYKKCNTPIEFSSTTGAITEIRSNNLLLLAITDSGLINLSTNVRVRYSDM